jgi:hypothetical protein
MNMLAIMDRFLALLRHHETSRSFGDEFRWGKHVSAVKTETHYALLRGTKFPLCSPIVPLLELLYRLSALLCAPFGKRKTLLGQGTLHMEHAS